MRVGAALGVLSLLLPEVAQSQTFNAATAQTTMFAIPTPDSLTYGITGGADGNIWFLETDGHRVGRITPAGAIAEFPASSTSSTQITNGPDGNLWFIASTGQLGRVTPAGAVSLLPVGDSFSFLADIVPGPDGNLWITNNQGSGFGFLGGVTVVGTIARLTPSGAQMQSYQLSRVNVSLGEITKGLNGDLWFTEREDNHIGRVTTSGVITEFKIQVGTPGRGPEIIAVAPDGHVWFTQDGGVFKMTPQGVVTEILPIGSGAGDITVGPDQKIWFSLFFSASRVIAFVSADDSITEVLLPPGVSANRLAAGPDGNIWFTSVQNDAIGRLDVATIAPIAVVPALSPLVLLALAIVLSLTGVLALRR